MGPHLPYLSHTMALQFSIVNDRLSVLEPYITQDMGHNGWAIDVTLSNIHEHYLFKSHFHLYKNTTEGMETP